MANSWLVSVLKRHNPLPIVSSMQPRPIFFSEEREKRMWKQEGCYKFGSENNGKTLKTH